MSNEYSDDEYSDDEEFTDTEDSDIQVGGSEPLKNEIELEVKTTEQSIPPQANEDFLILPEELLNPPDRPVIKKCGDPGTMIISCSIGKTIFPNCLCDLGAATNIMPIEVAEKLGIKGLKPGRAKFKLADQSIQPCFGILRDVPVIVDNIIVPTDFAVMKMKEEPDNPLILGRPFLATTNALINVAMGAVQLRFSELRRPTYTAKGNIFNSVTYEPSSDEDDDDPREPPLPFPYESEDEELIISMKPPDPTFYPHRKDPYSLRISDTPEPMEYEINVIRSETSPIQHILRAHHRRMLGPPRVVICKEDDPGPLYISCKIGNEKFDKCLCDTGAPVNIMSLETAIENGLHYLIQPNPSMRMAEHPTNKTYGLLENVMLRIGSYGVLADFMVVEMTPRMEHDFVLGRPFLKATKADINLYKETVQLNFEPFRSLIFSKDGTRASDPLEQNQPLRHLRSHEIGESSNSNPEIERSLDDLTLAPE